MKMLVRGAIVAVNVFILSWLAGCQQTSSVSWSTNSSEYQINAGQLLLTFDAMMHTKIDFVASGQSHSVVNDFQSSEYLQLDVGDVTDFKLIDVKREPLHDQLGKGTRYILSGESSNQIGKVVNVDIYDAYPSTALFSVAYKNNSNTPLKIKKWVNHHYQLISDVKSGPQFWSFQGASYADRRDWLVPLDNGFYQQNFMGMNSSDYGSGTPVVDVWSPRVGLAIGHLETKPKLVSLPVDYRQPKSGLHINIEYDRPVMLDPQQSLTSFRTFINAHTGDYYTSLVTYRRLMSGQGMAPPTFPESAYMPSWCAWGYERDFKIQDMIETLPKAKELGFKWAVLDDGWQIAEGDWRLNKEKFPNGDADMRALVARIKDANMHPRIWWAPLAADPGTPIFENEKDALLLDKDGKPVHITWWDSYYLCPAYLKNQTSSKDLVKKMIDDWGYEGLKIDGQHLNGVPQCFNPAHHHEHPEESVEALQEFWKMIYETAISINENAVVEICPCGDSYSYFNVPYMNQAVASDPLNSWQIRLKGKTLKALMGESAPYSGDHVELSDHKMDFASSVGIGAVIGTKFTWPEHKVPEKGYSLTKEKEKIFKKWVDIYNQKMLPKGIYRGELYDIGFDKPEAHAIEKGKNMYYALYADSYSGKFTLKGLKPGRYKVIDYENDKQLATIESSNPVVQLDFSNHLLIEVSPIDY